MALVTANEVHTFLQLSGSVDYGLINRLIPTVQSYIIDYTHKQFKSDVSILASTISFVGGVPATIIDSESKFIDNYLLYAEDILVVGSRYNDGFYAVKKNTAITSNTITLEVNESLNTEDAGQSITITKIVFPAALKEVAARMIGYQLKKNKDVSSEKIGDYSVSFVDSSGSYPSDILKSLKTYRRLYS